MLNFFKCILDKGVDSFVSAAAREDRRPSGLNDRNVFPASAEARDPQSKG